ncbi:MAG: hypothetical protein ACE5KV_00725 [Thermoplasmata archaeon]
MGNRVAIEIDYYRESDIIGLGLARGLRIMRSGNNTLFYTLLFVMDFFAFNALRDTPIRGRGATCGFSRSSLITSVILIM